MDWLREARIPGLPVWSPNGEPEVDALLRHMVIAPGQGPALRDNGLAELLQKRVDNVNRDAGEKRIKVVACAQPIEINLSVKNMDSSPDRRGEHRKHPERLYSRDSVLAFLDACSPEYLGTDASDIHRKTDLKRLVIKAFDHFCQHMDTSPFRARLRELGGAMNVVQLVAGESGLPGIPRAVATGNPRVDNLLRHMVVDADKGVLLRDRGLAELLGKQVYNVNRDAEEYRVDHTKLTQYIEIVLNSFFSEGPARGPASRFYHLQAVEAFLGESSDTYLPAPREELKAVVVAAFEHFETRVDTNPFRQRSRRLAKAQAVNQAKAERARLLTSWPGPYRVFTSTH